MLTTKVVSNKKPPLLSDSKSGGSTSPKYKKASHLALIKYLTALLIGLFSTATGTTREASNDVK